MPEFDLRQFSLSPDPRLWGSDLSPDLVEPDDDLHNPELVLEKTDATKKKKVAVTTRAITNVGCLVILLSALIVLLWVQVCIPIRRIPYLTNTKHRLPHHHIQRSMVLCGL